jgi:biofilm PGA synthesis N-glycosyltransferase PgaC
VTLVFLLVLVPVAIHLAWLVWLGFAPDASTGGDTMTGADVEWPRVEIFVPTLNEERFIAQKLENLQRLAYPRHLLSISILDGGSDDRTIELAAAAGAAFTGATPVDIVHTGVRDKAAQVNAGLARATADFILFTDADARLESDALSRLIAALRADETMGIAGAAVSPAIGEAHAAEHLHWRLLNWLHRQEARRGSIVTGPCFLMRRGVVSGIPESVVADDVFVSCAAAVEGFRVGWVDTLVTELRAPRTAREMFQYRRRRGSAYLREVLRFLPLAPRMAAPARGIFLWRAVLLLTVPFGGAALAVLCLLAAASFTTPAGSPKEEAAR